MNNKCYDDLSARFAVFILISYENVPVIDAISFYVIENNVELFHNVCKIDIQFLVQHNKLNTPATNTGNFKLLYIKFMRFYREQILQIFHQTPCNPVFPLGT